MSQNSTPVTSTNLSNLDLWAARSSQAIVSKALEELSSSDTAAQITETTKEQAKSVEILVTKTLGVIQENGIYAGMLYLLSRANKDKKIAEQIKLELLKLANRIINGQDQQPTEPPLPFLSEKICSDLDTLFLVKQLWEQTLIYARYGAKAQGKE